MQESPAHSGKEGVIARLVEGYAACTRSTELLMQGVRCPQKLSILGSTGENFGVSSRMQLSGPASAHARSHAAAHLVVVVGLQAQ